MKEKELFILDFDGVIVDSFDVCFSIEQRMNPHASRESFLRRFEGNIFSSLEEKKVDEQYVVDYFKIYEKEIMNLVIPEKRKEMLDRMSQNYDFVIVTSCAESVVEPFLDKEDSRGFFKDIYGYETEKSKVKKFERIFNTFEQPIDKSIFVTDSLGDLREASQVDLETVAVTSGFHDEKTLLRGKPSYVVSMLEDIQVAFLEEDAKK